MHVLIAGQFLLAATPSLASPPPPIEADIASARADAERVTKIAFGPRLAAPRPLARVRDASTSPPEPPLPALLAELSQSRGTSSLIIGPIVIAAALPLSTLGNRAWREACGPESSTRQCADGTTFAFLLHTLALGSYATGIALVAGGGKRRGKHDAAEDFRSRQPFRGVGGILAPGVTMLALGMAAMMSTTVLTVEARLDCTNARCVMQNQLWTNLGVLGGAYVAGLGAALLSYAAGYRRGRKRLSKFVWSPWAGRNAGGLSIGAQFG